MRSGGRAHSGVPGASLAQNQEEGGTAGVRQRDPVHALITTTPSFGFGAAINPAIRNIRGPLGALLSGCLALLAT